MGQKTVNQTDSLPKNTQALIQVLHLKSKPNLLVCVGHVVQFIGLVFQGKKVEE